MTTLKTNHFNEDAAKRYDERNSKLNPISHNLHFLMSLVLKDLPQRSRILSVGAGTGAEILFLSQVNPHWTFVAVDPSEAMLNVCRERLTSAGAADRCEFILGYVEDAPKEARFDAALSVLVAHFVKRDERVAFYQCMVDRLRSGGYLVNAEISYDLDSAEFPSMLTNWEAVQKLMGATPESLATLPKMLKEALSILSPSETESFLKQSGLQLPVRFFQAFMINGWYSVKD